MRKIEAVFVDGKEFKLGVNCTDIQIVFSYEFKKMKYGLREKFSLRRFFVNCFERFTAIFTR